MFSVHSNSDDVGDFHLKFGLHSTTHDGTGPTEAPDDLIDFRIKFLREELDEFIEGYAVGDTAQQFDALIDLVYVALGTAHLLGFPWQEGWDAVQFANMQKQRAQSADESKRGSTYDVVKPEGWQPPDIGVILARHGFPPNKGVDKDIPRCANCRRPQIPTNIKYVKSIIPELKNVHCVCGQWLRHEHA